MPMPWTVHSRSLLQSAPCTLAPVISFEIRFLLCTHHQPGKVAHLWTRPMGAAQQAAAVEVAATYRYSQTASACLQALHAFLLLALDAHQPCQPSHW